MTETPGPDLHSGMIFPPRAVYAGGGPAEGLRIPLPCLEENDCDAAGETVLIRVASVVSST